MGVFYSVQGSVTVKDTEVVQSLLSTLEDCLGEMEIDIAEGNGTLTIEVSGGTLCGYNDVEKIDKAVLAFGEHVAGKVGYFNCYINNENAPSLWVGPKEDVQKAVRKKMVQKAKKAISGLTLKEWEELCAELKALPPSKWIAK